MVTRKKIVKAIAVKEFKTKGERPKQWPLAFCGLGGLIIRISNNLRDEGK
jgi:hypothetical protein